MLKRLKREFEFILSNVSFIFLFAFITSLGGVILWVNGGAAWFLANAYNTDNTISISCAFILCLLIYAMIGAEVSIIIRTDTGLKSKKNNSLIAVTAAMAVYIFSLAWYAVFFCTRLSFFSIILILIAVIIGVVLFIITLKRLILLSILIFLTEVVEIYFLYVNISFYLSN